MVMEDPRISMDDPISTHHPWSKESLPQCGAQAGNPNPRALRHQPLAMLVTHWDDHLDHPHDHPNHATHQGYHPTILGLSDAWLMRPKYFGDWKQTTDKTHQVFIGFFDHFSAKVVENESGPCSTPFALFYSGQKFEPSTQGSQRFRFKLISVETFLTFTSIINQLTN